MKHDVTPDIQKTEDEWKAQLGPERYHILREAGTEAPFSGSLLQIQDDGTYLWAPAGSPSSDQTKSLSRTADGRVSRIPRKGKT